MRRSSRFTTALAISLFGFTAIGGGVGAQDRASTSAGETVDYLTQIEELIDEAANARQEILAEIQQIDEWLADDQTIVYDPGTPAAEAIRLDELGRELSVVGLLRPRDLSLRQLRSLVFVLDSASDGHVVDMLVAALSAGDRQRIVELLRVWKSMNDLALRGRKDELQRELQDIGELEAFIAAELQRLQSAAPTPPAAGTPTADGNDGATGLTVSNAAGPYSSCVFDTGYLLRQDKYPETLVVAWRTPDFDPDDAEFIFASAFEDRFGTLQDRIDAIRTNLPSDADVLYDGSFLGFCAWAEATCPGSPPKQGGLPVCENGEPLIRP